MKQRNNIYPLRNLLIKIIYVFIELFFFLKKKKKSLIPVVT